MSEWDLDQWWFFIFGTGYVTLSVKYFKLAYDASRYKISGHSLKAIANGFGCVIVGFLLVAIAYK